MSQNLPAHFVAAAESYLGGQRDIEVAALSFNDIARIASGDAPLTFDAYRADDEGNLVPVLVSVRAYRGGNAYVNTTYGISESTGRLDRSTPVGARISVVITDADGIGEVEGNLFTTKAAEKALKDYAEARKSCDILDDYKAAKATRKSLFLPLDSDVLSEESTGKTAVKPLAAFHGAKVTASFVVEGISPSALEAKIHLFIIEEFGGLAGNVQSIEAHPVRDQRVDVYDPVTARPLALNVLVDEVDLLPGGDLLGFTVRPAMDTTGAIVGR